MNAGSRKGPQRTLILGSGIAGLEALLALRDRAGDRTEVTVVAPIRSSPTSRSSSRPAPQGTT